MRFEILVLFVVGICVFSEAKKDLLLDEYGPLGSKADFYDEEYLQGGSTHLETDGPCKNLPTMWRKKPLSVDTRGTCFSACDDLDCKGNCKRVYPPNGEQQLRTIGLNRKIVSIKGCFYVERAGRPRPAAAVPAAPLSEEDY